MERETKDPEIVWACGGTISCQTNKESIRHVFAKGRAYFPEATICAYGKEMLQQIAGVEQILSIETLTGEKS